MIGRCGLILLFSGAFAGISAKCTPREQWEDHTNFDFAAKCPGFPAQSPRFDRPIDCVTREVVPEMANSIANGVFQCDKWCVYSLDSELAWLWMPAQQCFKQHSACRSIAKEVAEFEEAAAQICPGRGKKDCTPLVRSDLSLKTIQRVCPKHHSQGKPAFHSAVTCETGLPDGELAQSLVNGAFEDCKNWCVFSLKTPTELAWFWDHNRNCWTSTNDCLKIPKERQYAVNLRNKLCDAPCMEPRTSKQLSVDLISRKCVNYTADHSPEFHHAKLCETNPVREDEDLRVSLANFAFSECKNWCVYSLEEPMDKAWLWDPQRRCWRTKSDMCFALPEETEFATKVRDSLCMKVTPKHLKYRRKQRATPIPEDTGLLGDTATQEEAIAMYILFGKIVLAITGCIVLLQWLVPPQGEDVTEAEASKESQADTGRGVGQDESHAEQKGSEKKKKKKKPEKQESKKDQ